MHDFTPIMKIFVSSACSPKRNLQENLTFFKGKGYNWVELTGGITYTPSINNDILELKEELGIDIQLHNYSPPVKDDFVLNLASLDQHTFARSSNHVNASLKLAQQKSLGKYAVHAGFYIPIHANELGKTIKKRSLYDKERSFNQFVEQVRGLYAQYGDRLYIENNVVSAANFSSYGENPFMLTCSEEYFELKAEIPDLKILLDFAHLKVSCNTLGLSFERECELLADETDYLHISDNDGLVDTNQGLNRDTLLYDFLSQMNMRGRTITLEVYSGSEDLKRSYDLIERLA